MTVGGPIVVVKVGGSLLDWPELPKRLGRLLQPRAGERLVLVPGGGRLVDVLRGLDEVHRLGEPACHALAIQALDLTARALAAIVPGLEVVETLAMLEPVWSQGRIPVLAPRRFLDEDDARPDALEHSWRVTSDSIAAQVAIRLEAAELVLLKSARVQDAGDRAMASARGLVDPAFPRVSTRLPRVVLVNLRDERAQAIGI
jgi:aspartokinase-like uncharacterized kinase